MEYCAERDLFYSRIAIFVQHNVKRIHTNAKVLALDYVSLGDTILYVILMWDSEWEKHLCSHNEENVPSLIPTWIEPSYAIHSYVWNKKLLQSTLCVATPGATPDILNYLKSW